MTEDLNLGKGVFIVLGLILFSILVYYMTTEDNGTREEQIVEYIDGYMDVKEMKIGPFEITENMTLKDVKNLYGRYRNYPGAEGMIVTTYDEVCRIK